MRSELESSVEDNNTLRAMVFIASQLKRDQKAIDKSCQGCGCCQKKAEQPAKQAVKERKKSVSHKRPLTVKGAALAAQH